MMTYLFLEQSMYFGKSYYEVFRKHILNNLLGLFPSNHGNHFPCRGERDTS